MAAAVAAAAVAEQRLSNDPLLQPFRLKHLSLRNRVMSTSHAISYGEDAKPTDRYQRYHEEKAKGGIALTMFGGSTNVSADSASVFGQLHAGSDDVIPHFQAFAERIHKHGAALMVQLSHLGARTHWRADHWLPVVAPSRFREPLHRAIAREMDREDILRIVRDFGQAARRCREGGLDGLEVLAHGHLVGQFWSPHYNQRTDDFGGSLRNRCRFGLMVFEEMRRQAGDDYIMGIRTAMGEGFEGGLSDDECLEINRIFQDSGLIDFFNVNYGRIDTAIGMASGMPGMQLGLSPNLVRAGKFKREVKLPVFHACRITDMATARHAIRDGLVDMIGMTRAHIADPHIVNRIAAKQEERIRPCVGATYCSWQRRCIHNPSIGREAELPHEVEPALRKRKVVVVGAGPAGLEAARVAALRGHDVTLFEAAPRAGGQVLLATTVPSRRELIGIVDWRVAEIERMGVRIRYNTYAGAAEVAEENPDVVLVATGGLPDRDERVPGAEHRLSVWEALEDPSALQGDVLIYDGTGQIHAPTLAEVLAPRVASLTFVTRDMQPLQELSHLDRPFILKRLYSAGVTFRTDLRLRAVERAGNGYEAVLTNEFSDQVTRLACDRVVIEAGVVPVTELYDSLRGGSRNNGITDMDALLEGRVQDRASNPAGGFDLHLIGDALAARDIHTAVLDSYRLCRVL
jgi:2,4-dienoyl-CoA reductase-like NADH-dependent reductase (Old Yellow Enzyme family)/thioredoxin reductase